MGNIAKQPETTLLLFSLHITPESLGRRDVLRLQAGAPVKNTGKTRYNS
jgi:hypothetical protein